MKNKQLAMQGDCWLKITSPSAMMLMMAQERIEVYDDMNDRVRNVPVSCIRMHPGAFTHVREWDGKKRKEK